MTPGTLSAAWEACSRLAPQDLPRRLWQQNIHCHIYKKQTFVKTKTTEPAPRLIYLTILNFRLTL